MFLFLTYELSELIEYRHNFFAPLAIFCFYHTHIPITRSLYHTAIHIKQSTLQPLRHFISPYITPSPLRPVSFAFTLQTIINEIW